MRSRALTIAAAVAGYLAIEAALIWYSGLPDVPEMVVLVSTLAMLAGFIWGGRLPSVMGALKTLAAWTVSVLVFALLSVTLCAVAYAIVVITVMFGEPWTEKVVFSFLILCAFSVFSSPTLFYLASRKLPYRDLEAAADQWLADRARYGAVEMRRRSRIKRWSLCLPTLTVLLILYVWAPLQGTLSYPLKWRAGHLAGGSVRVPISWAGYQQELEEHHRYLVLLKTDNMLPATLQLGRKQISYSYISVLFEAKSDAEHNLQPTVEKFIRDAHLYEWELRPHTVQSRLQNINCWESRAWYFHDGYLLATCGSDDGKFLAEFNGYRADLNSFYEIVSSAEVRK